LPKLEATIYSEIIKKILKRNERLLPQYITDQLIFTIWYA